MRRKTVKSEAQKKKEAAVRAARELAKTKLRYGLDRRRPTEGDHAGSAGDKDVCAVS